MTPKSMTPAQYKSIRKSIGTQQCVADMLGMTRQLLSAREKGKARITPEAAIAIQQLAKP